MGHTDGVPRHRLQRGNPVSSPVQVVQSTGVNREHLWGSSFPFACCSSKASSATASPWGGGGGLLRSPFMKVHLCQGHQLPTTGKPSSKFSPDIMCMSSSLQDTDRVRYVWARSSLVMNDDWVLLKIVEFNLGTSRQAAWNVVVPASVGKRDRR